MSARANLAQRSSIERPAARHDVIHRACAGGLLAIEKVPRQVRQPFGRVDVVREHDRRRRRNGAPLSGDVRQKIGAQVERPPRKSRPPVHLAAAQTTDERGRRRPQRARHAPIADRQTRGCRWRFGERGELAQCVRVGGRRRVALIRQRHGAVARNELRKSCALQQRSRDAKRLPFGPCEPRAAGAHEPQIDECVVHAGVRSVDQIVNDGPRSAARR